MVLQSCFCKRIVPTVRERRVHPFVQPRATERSCVAAPFFVMTEQAQFDLGNLMIVQSGVVDNTRLRTDAHYLNSLAQVDTQLLVQKIFSLPTEATPDLRSRLAVLPERTTRLPREKRIPKPRAPTKWEEFAKEKGIMKRKRTRMEFDEAKGEYLARWGYKRAKNEDQWLVEHKEGDVSVEDPWSKMRKEKKERILKNKKHMERNVAKAAKGARLPGTIDLTTAAQPKKLKRKQLQKRKRRKEAGKEVKEADHVDIGLKVVQRSTASMGKFDKRARHEQAPPRQKGGRKNLKQTVAGEKQQNLSVLEGVMRKMGDGSMSSRRTKRKRPKIEQS